MTNHAPASRRVDLVVQEFHTFNYSFKQEVLPSLGSRPVDSTELWVSSNLHIRATVTQLENRPVHFVPKWLILSQTKVRELAVYAPESK